MPSRPILSRAKGLALALLLALGGGCARPRPPEATTSATPTVEALEASLLAAFSQHDPAAIAALFTEDAVVIEVNGAILTGRPAIRARIASLLPAVRGYSLSSRRSKQSGTLAYDQQTYQITFGAPGEEPSTITGHQVVILERQPEGSWRIAQSGSWSAPPAEMPDMPGMGR